MITASARMAPSICSQNGPSITRSRGSRYPPVSVSSMLRSDSSPSAMGSELVTMCSDFEASSRATAATVEPPSRITVWPFSIRPAVSLAMRLFSSLKPHAFHCIIEGAIRRRLHADRPAIHALQHAFFFQNVQIAADAGFRRFQLAAKSLRVDEVPGLEHLADSAVAVQQPSSSVRLAPRSSSLARPPRRP